jgi:chromosomal replication initiation ATPase DnaA
MTVGTAQAPPNMEQQVVGPLRERYVRLLLDKLEAQSAADAALCDRIERTLSPPAAWRSDQAVDPQPRRLRIADVIEVVARRYDLDPAALSGPSREEPIVAARHLAMRLARELTGKSYPEIGRAFNRDHLTVIHAMEVTEGMAVGDIRAELEDAFAVA